MRTCTAATIAQINAHGDFPHFRGRPGWLVAALWDAVHDRPMSLKRERRMCDALGIAAPLEPVEVDPCPDCGAVHNGGRCNGRPVTVRLVRQRTPPAPWVREATANLAKLLEAKQAP